MIIKMDDINRRNFYRMLLRWVGPGIFVTAVIFMIINPTPDQVKMPAGFYTPVLALELMKTPAEADQILGSDINSPLRQGFRNGVYLDMFFIILYSTLNISLVMLLFFNKNLNKILKTIAIGILLLAAAADYIENFALLKLIGPGGVGDISSSLTLLQTSTWIKWESLGAGAGIIGIGLIQNNKLIFGPMFLSLTLIGIAALFYRQLIEIFSLILAICWLTAWLKSSILKSGWFVHES